MADAWGSMLRIAAQHYSIAPDRFWRLSLAEWRALAGPRAAPVLPRGEFEALAAAYPDERRHP